MTRNTKKLLKEKQDAEKIVKIIREGTEETKLREDVSMEMYQKIQSPITKEIEKLSDKIEEHPLAINKLALEEPYELYELYAVEERKELTPRVNIFKDIDKEVLKNLIYH